MGKNYNNTKNKHQEVYSKVIGVLNKNNKIREDLLKRNIGIYEMSELKDLGMGYISNIYFNESSKPTSLGEYGLLAHTHFIQDDTDNISEYQQKIKDMTDIIDPKNYYQTRFYSKIKIEKERNFYDDYTHFINTVIGSPVTTMGILTKLFSYDETNQILRLESDGALAIQRVLTDFVQYDNMKFALEKTRIGTVTPNPFASLAGSVVTNINNFSNTDTKLGLLTNYLYAHTLKQAAQFNSIRRTPYITPEVYNQLGNKLNTLSLLSSESRIDSDTGRMSEDYGNNFMNTKSYENVTMDIFSNTNKIDETRDIANSRNALYINLMRNSDLYTPFEDGKQYGEYNNIGLLDTWINKTLISKTYFIWSEKDSSTYTPYSPNNNIDKFGNLIISEDDKNSLLYKTQELFNADNNALDTLINRYHTDNRGRDVEHNKISMFQTAISKFGISHGRNLLSKNAYLNNEEKEIEGYKTPYARTWTSRNQYDTVNKLIRSIKDDTGKSIGIDDLQKNWKFGRTQNGVNKLKENTVLNKNGFVNISPTVNNSSYTNSMFSIENLAWNDSFGKTKLKSEQIGPNGGRIMWFPPYDIKFNENISVDWGQNSFIGRGEKIYTYTNTERSGTLSFIMLVDHPSILNAWKNNNMDENDKEENLLRFFAGCDTLEIDGNVVKREKRKEEKIEAYKVDFVKENKTLDEVSYAFFPYCYSGVDEEHIVKAHNYIVNDYEGCRQDKGSFKVDDKYIKDEIDKTCYKTNQLNCTLNNVKKYYPDATISFVDLMQKFIKKEYKNDTFKYIIIQGISSSLENQNYKSNKLNTNRSKTIKSILKHWNIDNNKIIEGTPLSLNDEGITYPYSSINDAKNRCVKIILRKEPIEETTSEEITTDNNVISEKNEKTKPSKKEIRRKKREEKKEKKQNEKELKNEIKNLKKDLKGIEDFVKTINVEGRYEEGIFKTVNYINVSRLYDMIDDDKKLDSIYNEYQYFSQIQENDTFLYKRIIDKIKYFTPAFHSMTPEGFNARLGFLHQCTRQGATSAVSEGGVAGNMAFGRPPICVLRIGDFYHTKIVIDSITIDYDNQGLQWDMNPEGIGLQPMFARISLNFKFLGGSDLTGPISRLQNALSFNYYANQSVYDERSIENKKN